MNKMIGKLNYEVLYSGQFPERRLVKIPKGKVSIYRTRPLNPEETNSAIDNYYQIGIETTRLFTLIDLFSHIVSSHGFDQLRTKEQLGYSVSVDTRSQCGVRGFRVLIQSDSKDPTYLDSRIESWISDLEAFIKNLSTEEFEKYNTSLIALYLEKDKSLKFEVARFKIEIEDPKSYKFDRAQQYAEMLKTFHLSDVLEIYNTYIKQGSPKRRKLSSQIYGKGHEMTPITNPDTILIQDDFRSYKKTLQLYNLIYNRSDF